MGGLVGAILHPNPRSALVVGLGTGSTAGWLGAVPSMERVNVVELEPVVLDVARACTAVNHDVLHNPKVTIRIADAREVLLTSRDRYDIVFSEPSNPYRAGIASLFTREFYEAVSARLNHGGIFLQWVQAYDIDAETLRTIYATMGTVFPQVTTWRTHAGDLLMAATREPITFDIDRLRQRVTEEPYRTALHATWRVESAEGFLSHFVANDRLTRVAARGANLNSDDRTPIEFGFARALGDANRFGMMTQLLSLAAVLGADRPERISGTIDWKNVMAQRASEAKIPTVAPTADENAHHDVATAWSNNDFRGAVNAWTEHGRWQPVNSAETAMLAELQVTGGNDNPMPLLQALRGRDPIEADVLEARILMRNGNVAGATELVRRAFVANRADPWPNAPIMSRAFAFATILASRNRSSAVILYDALDRPFAAGQFEQTRRSTRLALARQLDGCGPRTIAALRAFEPWVPWDVATLQLRVDCYAYAGPRESAMIAAEELGDFLEKEPQRLTR